MPGLQNNYVTGLLGSLGQLLNASRFETATAASQFGTTIGGLAGFQWGSQTATASANVYLQQQFMLLQQFFPIQGHQAQQNIYMAAPNDSKALQLATEKRIAASNRAEELLLTFLREEHRKTYKEAGHFDVEVKGRVYRIHKGRSMNITLLDKKGVKICRYCAHPGTYVPDADTMLAQYLMLTTDEKKFLSIANEHRLAA